MTIDEDYIVMSPDEPLVAIYENYAGWDKTKSRCEIQGKLLFSAPILIGGGGTPRLPLAPVFEPLAK